MAESIYGEDFNIHFTNGGAATLFESLIFLGKELPEEKTSRELIEYLQYSLDNFGYGCRFFDIENLPDELDFKHLAEYARLINLFCIELTKADSKLDVAVSLGFLSRMNWLARLMNLYLLIEKQLAKNGIEIPAQNIPLKTDEAVTIERQRLLAVYEKTKNRLEKTERAKLWGRIVELCEQDKTVNDLNILSQAYFHYAELLDDSVSKEKELSIWKRLLEIEKQIGDDEEGIKLLSEIIEGIEE